MFNTPIEKQTRKHTHTFM